MNRLLRSSRAHKARRSTRRCEVLDWRSEPICTSLSQRSMQLPSQCSSCDREAFSVFPFLLLLTIIFWSELEVAHSTRPPRGAALCLARWVDLTRLSAREGVIANIQVSRYQGRRMKPRSGHNDAIGGILVKLTRQLHRVNRNTYINEDEPNCWHLGHRIKPSLCIHGQCQPPRLGEHFNFPSADGRNQDFAVSRLDFDSFACGTAQLRVPSPPPNQCMRVQHDHCAASHASSPTRE